MALKKVKRFYEITTSSGPIDAIRLSQRALENRILTVAPKTIEKPLATYRAEKDVQKYPNSPYPYEVYWVSPHDIERFTGREWPPWKNKREHLGSVRGGDWDLREAPIKDSHEDAKEAYNLFRADTFSESTFFTSLRDHFINGTEWEDTEFVSECLSLAEQNIRSWKGYTSKDKILSHCKNVDKLYEEICNSGYQTQRALGHTHPRNVVNEVTVDIGREGDLLFVNGRHRMSIAKILDLEVMPVCVLVRHAEWMEKRQCYAAEKLQECV